jgi:mycofactocin precursor
MSVQEANTAEQTEAPVLPAQLSSQGGEDEEDYGAELSDEELGELLVREITIDGMCGVY